MMTTTQINSAAKNLQPGDRFYYTGDMANGDSFGTITARIEDKWGLSYNVEFDDERFDGDTKTAHRLMPMSFTAGPGQRFKTLAQYDAERKAAVARMKALVAG
jgi:hypothetical protein